MDPAAIAVPSGGCQRVETMAENVAGIAVPAEQFGIGKAIDLPGQNPQPLETKVSRSAVMIERFVYTAMDAIDACASPERQRGVKQPFADDPRRWHRPSGMGNRQRRPLAGVLDLAGNVLDQMGLVAMNDQKRIGLGHDNDIIKPGNGQKPVFGTQVAVGDINGQHIAKPGVAALIERRSVMQLVP